MNVISRGVRNAFRNGIRTIGVVLILSLSIGLALTMLIARGAVDTKIKQVKASIGNTITISPAGARGFMGGGEPLTEEQITKAKSIAHVTAVTITLQNRLTSDNSSLISAIEAGSLGRRFNDGPSSGGSAQTRVFTPPVVLTGVSTLSGNIIEGGNSLTLTSGEKFDPSKDAAVAMIGKTLAEKNSLSVGSTFKVYNTDVKVVGIYDAGTTFANNSAVMPISTVQRLSGQTGQISSAIVTIDNVANVEAATTAIQSALGSDVADVTNTQSAVESALTPIENIKTISAYSLIGALAAGAIIILLTMMMIVRERRREIGVLKAIGSSNVKVMTQFMAEAVTFTLLSAAVGLCIGVAAGGPVTNVLATSNASNVQTTGQTMGRGGFGGPGRAFNRVAGLGGQSLRSLQTSAGWDILFYGLGAALFIALLGSAIPALLIAKVRPAEVMRAE